MVLKLRAIVALFGLLGLGVAAASAHERHNQNKTAEITVQNGAGAIVGHAANPAAAGAHGREGEADPSPAFGDRLLSFAGRMHPFAVHFPIALFPVGWIALILARRRGGRVELIRAIIVVAGAAAVGGAALGWLNADAGLVDQDTVQLVHRWLGSLLAVFGAVLAIWAWRRADAIDGRGMVWALGGMTAALLVQGWLGAALTHGIEHMIF